MTAHVTGHSCHDADTCAACAGTCVGHTPKVTYIMPAWVIEGTISTINSIGTEIYAVLKQSTKHSSSLQRRCDKGISQNQFNEDDSITHVPMHPTCYNR